MSSLQALLFDVDGAIIESEDMHRRAFNASFREFGLAWHWDDAIYKELLTVGGGKERLRYYITRSHPDFALRPDFYSFIESMHRAKSLAFRQLVSESGIDLRPGARRLIYEAKKENLKLAIVTSTSRANIDAIFSQDLDDLLSLFDVVGDGDKVPSKKPAPDIYSWVMSELGISANNCLSIEATPRGIKGSIAAGICAIATISAYMEGEDLSGALAVLSDLGEHNKAFKLISGQAFGHKYVDISLLRRWHSEANKDSIN